MSDTWYQDPIVLPPFIDGFGNAWTFDGRRLNPAPDATIAAMLTERWPDIVATRQPEPLEPITWADVETMIARFPPFPGCPIEGHKGCSLWDCRWDPEYTRR